MKLLLILLALIVGAWLGEYMKRANLAERKVEKLKALILLVDPCVSSTEVGDTQLKQWSEYLKHFPEDI